MGTMADDDPTEKFFTDYKDAIPVVLAERVWVDIDWSFDDILRTG